MKIKLICVCSLVMIKLSALTGQNALQIPPALYGPVYDLNVQNGVVEFIPGITTPTYGINGNILGPTLFADKGDVVTLNVTNSLTGTGNSTTMHWHGFHLPASADGGPHQVIDQGDTWSPSFTVMNDASTLWYHPHGDGKTDLQVARGLAGFFIIKDEVENALTLPRTYGVDDIPLAIQTKAFDVLHQIAIATEMDTLPMVNATVDAVADLPAQVVRLRLLNGSSMRTFHIGFDNNQLFYVIAGDGGLLSEPVALNRLILAPGERYEILVDLSGMESEVLTMMSFGSTLPSGMYGAANPSGMGMGTITGYDANPLNGSDFSLLKIQVIDQTADPVTEIPSSLTPPITTPAYTATRVFNLEPESMGMDNMVMGPFVINGASFNMDIVNEIVPINTIEKWRINNNTGIAHPFHIHEGQFIIDNINGAEPDPVDRGMQDVVYIPAGQYAEVIKTFSDFADDQVPYMYHCHMLHHEDDGMMGSFTVVAQDEVINDHIVPPLIYPNPVASNSTFSIVTEGEFERMEIYNSMGEIVYLDDFHQQAVNAYTIDGLPSGVFIIKLINGKN
ncbi:MAG TPA: multicopper oxidase domain-containing protein, partial [Chitinophagales bacterium]|nr:multicopper oxidase domain-containing protein [Chitinophagales bacterium]